MAGSPDGVVTSARPLPDPAPRERISRTTATPVPPIWSGIGETLRRDGRFVEFRIGEVNDWVLEVWRGERCLAFARLDAWMNDRARIEPWLQLVPTGGTLLCLVGEGYPLDLGTPLNSGVFDVLPPAPAPERLLITLKNAFDLVDVRARAESRNKLLRRYRYELGELFDIARVITSERDTTRLLSIILEKSRFITGADAGSIYVVEGNDPDVTKRSLHFKLSQNDSLPYPATEFTIPISTRSIAGAAAVRQQFINIPDVYDLPPEAEYRFDRSFDEKMGYRTRSMLTAPLISHNDEVIGIIQLINKKRDRDRKLLTPSDAEEQVVSFDTRSEELLQTLAAQAGISLENAILYESLRHAFEGFVRASVQAIEQRDPTTSGHSLRVSVLSVALAESVDRNDAGTYRDTRFSRDELKEIEYAAMLHDFGKVGVREQVLLKAKKLYEPQLEIVRQRFGFARQQAEIDALRRKIDHLSRGASPEEIERIENEFAARLGQLEGSLRAIVEANEPTVLRGGEFKRIEEIASETYIDPSGNPKPLLLPDEVAALRISKGSLTSEELREIQSHATHTYNFLSRIPWGKGFFRVPQIAGAHHERLDGSGYPHRLKSDEIPLPSKILSVADIFDALTASDRPYKAAVPVNKALDILDLEVKSNHIDGDLFRIFVESKAYKVVEQNLTY